MNLILGHLIGDYLTQNSWMAVNKVRSDVIGYLACFTHCCVYSMAVSAYLFLGNQAFDWRAIDATALPVIIFITHFPIDKLSLGKIWLERFLGTPMPKPGGAITIRSIFTIFVYIVVDNTMHLILMVTLIKVFYPGLLL